MSDKNKIKILAVEDSKMAQMAIEIVLSNYVCELTFAENHRDAIACFKGYYYDIILMDIGLGDSDGYAVTQEIRELEQKSHRVPTPIIGITIHLTEACQEACLLSGMNAAFQKPLEKPTIEFIFEQFLKNKKY